MSKNSLITLWLGLTFLFLAVTVSASQRDDETAIVNALDAEVEALVARSKPVEWGMKHACLYYAVAGQYLLAKQGIDAALWVGAVIYYPGTSRHHEISPHAWLETNHYFIDYSTLPRWGKTMIIPHNRVASDPERVNPGFARVLALHRPVDYDLIDYLAEHRARFERIVSGR